MSDNPPKKVSADTYKLVLYVVLFFAVTNFFGYLLLDNYNAAIFMSVVGFVSSQFSKNMIVVLGASIVVTSLFQFRILLALI